jgi:hypothetical protein
MANPGNKTIDAIAVVFKDMRADGHRDELIANRPDTEERNPSL